MSVDRSSIGFESPIGRLHVTATADHLIGVKLRSPEMPDGVGSEQAHQRCQQAKTEILEYLTGERDRFTLPFRVLGSTFLQTAMVALTEIPYGRTVTYGQLARQLREPGASRAVGKACGANPVPLIVPCHRVIGSGTVGGFGGGVDMKRWLLELEARRRPPRAMGEGDGAPELGVEIAGEQGSLF